jgi:hypothetical protein
MSGVRENRSVNFRIALKCSALAILLVIVSSVLLAVPAAGTSDSSTLTTSVSPSGSTYTYKYTLANNPGSSDPINIIQIHFDGLASVSSTPPTNWIFYPDQANGFFEWQCICSGATSQSLQPGQSLDFVATSDSSYRTDDIRLVDWNQVQAGSLSGGTLSPSSLSSQPVPATLGPRTVTGTPTNGTVGGTDVPINKLTLLAPYFGLALAVGSLAFAATVIYTRTVKRSKRVRESNSPP